MESLSHSDQGITPKEGTAVRLDGIPANLLNYWDYPVLAKCVECGGDVRTESFYEFWRHIPPQIKTP